MAGTTGGTVLVVGAGRMGSHIGVSFALEGRDVMWLVRDPGRADVAIRAALAVAVEASLCSPARADALGQQRRLITGIDGVGDPPHLIIESVAESLELKASVLAPLARRWRQAVVATNTSSLSVTAIGAMLDAGVRTVGMHFASPALLTPLVEIVPGERTSASTAALAVDAVRSIRKQPVLVRREVPGFIWNRLQFALLREALWLVERGVTDAATVDLVVREILGPRWRMTGPFETAALGGAELFATVAQELFPQLAHDVDATSLPGHLPFAPARLEELRMARDAALVAEARLERGLATG